MTLHFALRIQAVHLKHLPVFQPHCPFLGVLNQDFWSATVDAGDPTRAWFMNFGLFPFTNDAVSNTGKAFPTWVWCVRGGNNAD